MLKSPCVLCSSVTLPSTGTVLRSFKPANQLVPATCNPQAQECATRGVRLSCRPGRLETVANTGAVPCSESEMMATPAPSAMSSTELDSMELSAVAQEAIGFADDQFMELSTSGASLYDVALFTEHSSSAGGRLNQSGASTSNGSLRRMLQNTKARDESSLSPSGMSLASLGSLSRSTRRLSGLIDVDEALDDSIAWRHTGVKVEDEDGNALDVCGNGTAEGKQVTSADLPGGRIIRGTAAAAATTAAAAEAAASTRTAPAVAAAAAEAGLDAAAEAATVAVRSPLLDAAESRTSGEGHPVSGAAGGAKTQLTTTAVEVPPVAEGMAHGGTVRELSLGVAELRQQSYHRRMACASVGSSRSAPPLPVGVDLAPPAASFSSSTSRQQSQQQQQRQQHPGSGAASGLDAWRPGRAQGEMMAPHLSDSLDGSSGGVGCSSSVGEGSSNGSNNGTISKIRKKGGQRARALVRRTFQGLGHALQGTAKGASENRSVSLEGDSSVTSGSWSADSSAAGAVRGAAGAHSDSPETTSQPLDHVIGTAGISPLPESTPTTSTPAAHAAVVATTSTRAATPPAPHGAGVVVASSQQQAGAAAKPGGSGGGLRGKIVQVWGSRRKHEKKEPEKQARDGPQQGRDRAQTQQAGGGLGGAPGMPAVPRSAILQPAGGGGGGFAFLPAQDQSLDAYQEWVQSRSALAGIDSGKPVGAPVRLEGTDGNGGGGSSGSHPHDDGVFPTTPLGRSTRSFDPNLSPSTGDVDGSSMSLPPLLGTHAALASLGASFDPNRSTRSWFDMSTDSTNRPSPGTDAGLLWQQTHQHHQHHQLQRQQQLQHVLPTVPAQQGLPSETPALPDSMSAAAGATAAATARETGGAAGAATVALSTSPGAATESSSPAVTPTQNAIQTEAAAAAATAAATAAAAALPATLLDEDELVGELSDLSISSGRRRSKARLVLASAIANDATSADTISDHGSIIGNAGHAVSVSGDSGSDGITRADTPVSSCAAAAAAAVPTLPTDGAHHEWEGVVIGTGGRSDASLVPARCFSAEVVPNVAPGDPSSWPEHGSLDRGSLGKRATTLPDDWSLAMHQQVLPWGGVEALGGTRAQRRNASRGGGSGGAVGPRLPPMAAGQSSAPLGKEGAVPSAAAAAALSTAAAAASGACGGGDGGGGDMALDTVGGLGREGLRLPPTSASSTLYHRSTRAQSVDVGVLQTMTRLRDSESKRAGADQQAMGWAAGWPPRQDEGFGLAGEGSTLPPVESLMSGALSPPSSMPQRSFSADTSTSDSRSFRHKRGATSQDGAAQSGGVGVYVDGGVFGSLDCSETMAGRWPSDGGSSSGVGGGGGSFRFEDSFQGKNGGFQSICPATSPPLDGDDSIHARPLSDGREGARDCTPRGSWSALHAMIPTPGVKPGGGAGPGTGAAEGGVEAAAGAGQQHSRRATIPQRIASMDEQGIRRKSHAEVLGVLAGDGQGSGGGEVGGGLAGVGTGRAHSGGSSSWGSAPSSFG